jgi:Lsr2 protein
MAREKITRVTSDLTGTSYEGEDFPAVKLTINGKSGTRDLTPDETAALETFVTTGDANALRALLTPEPAPVRAAPARRRSRGTSPRTESSNENTAIREWWGTPEGRKATETPADAVIPERGRIPGNVKDAYSSRPGQAPASPAASPAASVPETAGNKAA